MRLNTLSITIFLLTLSVVMADTPKEHHECPAPIGVMGEHQHKAGEIMLGYRFMTMNMQGLQSGSDAVETTEVLKDFMMTPTAMVMRMHMFGAMFAPHDKITFIGMTSYQQRSMDMEGAHMHTTGHHNHPVGMHEMASAGIGDVKLESLLTLRKGHNVTFLGNVIPS